MWNRAEGLEEFCFPAMAHKPPAPKKPIPWSSWLLFSELPSFSWSTFAILISIVTFLFLLQSLLISQGKCISRSVHNLSAMVTHSTPAHNLLLPPPSQPHHHPHHPTSLSKIVFAIAGAATNWPDRKHYIKRWYNAGKPSNNSNSNNSTTAVRAIVWLDQEVNGTWDHDAPPFKVSEDISNFPFNPRKRTATRIARIVSETYRLGLADVDWFVMGDDDTFFLPENVVKVLSKYDPAGMHYVGSNSETHAQNLAYSFHMAFGGGGFAISVALAGELAKMQDACLARYPNLFGSDERMFVCMSELGVPLTKESGFHQMDIRGNAMGLLAAHPQTPLVSIHHMDLIDPIFPGLTKHAALDHLLEAAKVESASVLEQSMCYTRGRKWSFSVSWGYVVQAHEGFLAPRELETPLRTFYSIRRGHATVDFPFNTREVAKEPCKRPAMFYMKFVRGTSGNTHGLLESEYLRNEDLTVTRPSCGADLKPLDTVRRIRVLKKPVADSGFQAPRRSCCRVNSWSKDSIELQLSECEFRETLLTSSLQ